MAADPQARRRRRAGLGRRGLPAERQVGPHERRGQGERARDLGPRGARRDRGDRPVGRARGADAALPRADEGDPRDQGVPRRGLAVRDQVGRLPRRGGRRATARSAVHAQRQRRRGVLPAAAHPADVDRRPRGDRRRRGRRARRATAARTSACSRSGSARAGRAGRCRWSTRRSTCCTSTAGRCVDVPLEARKRLLELVLRPNARVQYAQAHRHRGPRVLRGGQGAGAGGDRRQAPPIAVRARPPRRRRGSRSRPGPSRSWWSAAGRPGRGARRSSGRWSSASTRTSKLRFAGKVGLRVRRAGRARSCGRCSTALETDAPPFDPPPAAGLPGPLGRRPRRRPLDPAGARDPCGDRRLDPGRPRAPDGVQGARARARPARGRS